jgi:hypothetical protein
VRYTFFDIVNFKGIEKVRLDLSKSPKSKIHTLIGLNESGKTTILEAINMWSFREDLKSLNLPGYEFPDIHECIPISKRSNFNQSISIEAGCELDSNDQSNIRKRVKETHGITLTKNIEPFTIKQKYEFKNSRFTSTGVKNTWSIKLEGRVDRQSKSWPLKEEAWQNVVSIIKEFLPRIVYFPNFLFDIPNKIYLENNLSSEGKYQFYKSVLQDILDKIGDNTNINDHILARANSSEEFDKKSLESVLLNMGENITRTVFSSWDRIFRRPAGRKEIVVDIKNDENNHLYLILKLKEGSEIYEISERSLGFRWFFTYLLLTQYRGFRINGPKDVLFLFDEPASNLHSSAQTQLLESFNELPESCSVIYTTHSHHLIKPEWLDGAFVVKNDGLHYTEEDDQYSSKKTIISATRYREFAVKYPDQYTYFQPVLDLLDYRPSVFENVPNVVMLEGKSDYFIFKLISNYLENFEIPDLLPGTGAGTLDDIIRLYSAWGRNFIILLDSDKEGSKQKSRYKELFGSLMHNRLYTLADINKEWDKCGIENLFESNDALKIQQLVYPNTTSFDKKLFQRAIQEAIMLKKDISLSDETKKNFKNIFKMFPKWLSKAAE